MSTSELIAAVGLTATSQSRTSAAARIAARVASGKNVEANFGEILSRFQQRRVETAVVGNSLPTAVAGRASLVTADLSSVARVAADVYARPEPAPQLPPVLGGPALPGERYARPEPAAQLPPMLDGRMLPGERYVRPEPEHPLPPVLGPVVTPGERYVGPEPAPEGPGGSS